MRLDRLTKSLFEKSFGEAICPETEFFRQNSVSSVFPPDKWHIPPVPFRLSRLSRFIGDLSGRIPPAPILSGDLSGERTPACGENLRPAAPITRTSPLTRGARGVPVSFRSRSEGSDESGPGLGTDDLSGDLVS